MGDIEAGLRIKTYSNEFYIEVSLVAGFTVLLCVILHFLYKTIFGAEKKEALKDEVAVDLGPNTPGPGESSSVGGDSMAGVASTLLLPLHPLHLLHPSRSQHLSHLISKITIQLNNNNKYPTPSRLMILPVEPSSRTTNESEDVPLDLSVNPTLKVHSPPVPEINPFICESCGQTFEVHDRLAKHVASRHRNRTPDSAKPYECEICLRRFSRSDMLTRHNRLHTGFKPYSCSVCGQLFSRSDHLASHQRTHTGEKPYRCPTCPYAACRRDMITRHMKTHTRRQQPG